jgi:hypothetical protein
MVIPAEFLSGNLKKTGFLLNTCRNDILRRMLKKE